MDLSVLIPARNEQFLARTIEDVLHNARADTEVIAVCDGNWPDPGVGQDPRVNLIYHHEPIGQRAATNEAARLSRARFVMKLDAHCAVGKGFDVKLMADCEPDWTVIPRMYNLHVFDWKCEK
jgi:glycosyltransferase involved in cell wall biosynthesis